MSKSFEVQGLIHTIGDTTEYGSNGFTKREFVIKLTGEGENSAYPNYVALELIKDKCSLMDAYNEGDEIKAQFNLSGRLWSAPGKPEKCFTSLQAWKIESAGAGESFSQQVPPANYDASYAASADKDGFDDDIPF